MLPKAFTNLVKYQTTLKSVLMRRKAKQIKMKLVLYIGKMSRMKFVQESLMRKQRGILNSQNIQRP